MSAVFLYLLVMRAFALYFLGKCGPRFAVPASGCKTELEEMIGTIFLTKRSVKRDVPGICVGVRARHAIR